MRKLPAEAGVVPLLVALAACGAFGSSKSDPGGGAAGGLPCGSSSCTGDDICCWVDVANVGADNGGYTCMPEQQCASVRSNMVLACESDARCAASGPDERCCASATAGPNLSGTHCVKTQCGAGEVSVCSLNQKPDPCGAQDSCTRVITPLGYGFCTH
jgi:hypothetical protein